MTVHIVKPRYTTLYTVVDHSVYLCRYAYMGMRTRALVSLGTSRAKAHGIFGG